MFLVEGNAPAQGSGLAGVYNNNNFLYDSSGMALDRVPASIVGAGGQMTPPDDYPIGDRNLVGGIAGADITAWLEIWDYAGGASFRAFVSEDLDDKTLFVFFDSSIIGRDLKKA